MIQSLDAPDPSRNCSLCPRLKDFINHHRTLSPDWHNAPVDTWVSAKGDEDVQLLIIGLAPGLKGANRTGRPFTGDYAGDLLYSTMLKHGFATGIYGREAADGLQLAGTAITNAVRCVPPENKPTSLEINTCRPFLINTLNRFANLKALLTLGKISHDSTARALGVKLSTVPFGHNRRYQMNRYKVFSSYHCSRYNTNTGRLTDEMFGDVFENIKGFVSQK